MQSSRVGRRTFLTTSGSLMGAATGFVSASSQAAVTSPQNANAATSPQCFDRQDDHGVVLHSETHKSNLMKGFPPPEDKRVTLENWAESGAHVRYAQQNSEVVFRTVPIERGDEPVWVLPRKMIDRTDFEEAQVHWGPSVTDAGLISVAEWLDRSETDAFVVMHDGHIVAEHYWGDMTPQTRHHLMCGAKSILGTILAPYFLDGDLAQDAAVTSYVPQLAETGFEGAKICHLMDQTISLEYEEQWDYGNRQWTWGTREFREAEHLMGQCMRISGLFPPLPHERNVGLQDYLYSQERGTRAR